MDKIVINGGIGLNGIIAISGAKNAVLPIMAASLMARGETKIHQAPDLRDTRTMASLMEIVGAKIKFSNNIFTIDSTDVNNPVAPYELVKTMRASFYILGPMLSRFGWAKVSLPGGCAWGPRPVDFHLKGFEKLGAKVNLEGGYINVKVDQLKGNRIRFDIPSVGATGNVLMAAVTARGESVIENAAREPEIVQLCEFLNSMGAKIHNLGTDRLEIEGVDNLHTQDITVIPDRIEAGTFLVAGAAMGNITLKNVRPDHLTAVLDKLEEAGANVTSDKDVITIEKAGRIKPVDVITDVYPGFPTDLQAQWISLMSIADGASMVTDTVYHDRFSHIPELVRLGARIKVDNNTAFIHGVDGLAGAPVMSTDIRASASLIIGGLLATGRTDVSRIYHIDRGYEKIEEKFSKLGADIKRESE